MLVLVMVTFPVVAVIAADVAQATASVSSVEGLDGRIGSAQARVETQPGIGKVFQAADPDTGGFAAEGGHHTAPTTLTDIERALGGSRPATELRTPRRTSRPVSVCWWSAPRASTCRARCRTGCSG